jgi:hypothetical protein
MSKPAPTPGQDELPLTSVLAHKLFPGRAMLTVAEVAHACGVDKQHITNLIEVGDLLAIDLRTTKPAKPSELKAKHKSIRQWLRIPTSAYDALITARKTL